MNNLKAKLLVGVLFTATLVGGWSSINTTLSEEERVIIIQDNLEEVQKPQQTAMVAVEDNLEEQEDVEDVYIEEVHDCEDYGVNGDTVMNYTEVEAKRVYDSMLDNSKAIYDVPNGGGAKPWNITYMSYTAVTKESSPQYKLLHSDMCYTDEQTGIRMVNGLYCVAIGTGFHAPVGTVITLVTEEDVIPCIVTDIKANCHTDATNTYCVADGSVVEFVIDKTVFHGSDMYPDEFDNTVRKIAVYDTMI